MNTIPKNEFPTAWNHSLSWSAITGGVLSTITLGLLFSLIGAALGLAVFKPEMETIKSLNISAVLWIIVSSAIAIFLGGIITGYYSSKIDSRQGAIFHGLILWSILFIFNLFLAASSVGVLLSGSAQLAGKMLDVSKEIIPIGNPFSEDVKNTVKSAGQKAIGKITDQAEKLINQVSKNDENKQSIKLSILSSADKNKQELIKDIKNYLINTESDKQEKLQEKIADQIVTYTNLNKDQVESIVKNWQKIYQTAVQKASDKVEKFKEKTKSAAYKFSSILSSLALVSIFSMLLSLITSILGCLIGRNRGNKIL